MAPHYSRGHEAIMSKPYNITPFTNALGQVIQPGDKVLVVTEGYSHSIKCRTGIYLGSRGEGRHVNTVVRLTYKASSFLKKDGTPCSYTSPEKDRYGDYERTCQQTYYCNRLFKLA